MKKVKAIFSIFLLSILVASCSSDDGGDRNDVDRIVGLWKVTDVRANGISIYDYINEGETACFLQTEVQFNNDHSILMQTYTINPVNEDLGCVELPEQEGTWSKENNVYSFTVEGETSSQELNFADDNHFTFTSEMEGLQYEVVFGRQ